MHDSVKVVTLMLSLAAGSEEGAFGKKEGELRPLQDDPGYQCPPKYPHLLAYHSNPMHGLWCFASKDGTGPSCNIVTLAPPPRGKTWGSNPNVPNCVEEGQDPPSFTKHQHGGETCSHGEPVDATLLVWGHWDVIVKAVYASFYLRYGAVPKSVERAYLTLIDTWNHFKVRPVPCDLPMLHRCLHPHDLRHRDARARRTAATTHSLLLLIFLYSPSPARQEGCHGTEGRVRAHANCKTKSTAADFTTSFHKTIESLANYGFDASKTVVFAARHPNRLGFAQNGLHRTGAALATDQALCVQWGARHTEAWRGAHYFKYGWDLEFFLELGYPASFVDETMEHWLAMDKRAVVVVLHPQAVARDGVKWAGARKILEQCSLEDSILLHKDVAMNGVAMQHLLLREHGGEAWARAPSLLEKVAESHVSGLTSPVARFVVIRGDQPRMTECQKRLRAHYGSQDSSDQGKGGCCHIGDSPAQHVALGRQVFNTNTLTYWRRAAPSPAMDKLARALRASLQDGAKAKLIPLGQGHWAFPDSFVVKTRGGAAMKPVFVYGDGDPPEDETHTISALSMNHRELFKANGAVLQVRALHPNVASTAIWSEADRPIDFIYAAKNYAWGDGFKFTPSELYG